MTTASAVAYGMSGISMPISSSSQINKGDLDKMANGFAPKSRHGKSGGKSGAKSGGGGGGGGSGAALAGGKTDNDVIAELLSDFKEYVSPDAISVASASSRSRRHRNKSGRAKDSDTASDSASDSSSTMSMSTSSSGASSRSSRSSKSTSTRSSRRHKRESGRERGREGDDRKHGSKKPVPAFTPGYINVDDQAYKRQLLDSALGVNTAITASNVPADLSSKVLTRDLRMAVIDRANEQRAILVENGIDVTNIPEFQESDSDDAVMAIADAIKQKYDRMNNCDIFMTAVELGTGTMEDIFDGKRAILGWQINLKGWSNAVMDKMQRHRLRNDTIVRQLKQQYGLGIGTELAYDLVSSAYLTNKLNKTREKRTASSGPAAAQPPRPDPSVMGRDLAILNNVLSGVNLD